MKPLAVHFLLLALQTAPPPELDLTPTSPAQPQVETQVEVGELFLKSNAAYEAGDFSRAIELYEAIIASGVDDGYLYFNLGNAYLRNGELGPAIAAYRRCQTSRPRDQDVRANLAFARRSAKDAIEPPEPSPVWRTLFFWHYGLSRQELLGTTVVLNLLVWGLLTLRLYRRGSEVLRWSLMVVLLLALATGGSLVVRFVYPTEIAVIVPQEIEVHSGTSTETVVRFKLHAGTELRALDTRDGWIRIVLPDGQQGWIESEHAQLVTL